MKGRIIHITLAVAYVLTSASLGQAQPEVLIVDPIDHPPPDNMWQDSAGFLWLDMGGDVAELFDGYRFVQDAHYWPTLEVYRISSSFVAHDGAVWIGTYGLLARSTGFYGRVDTLNHLFPDSSVGAVYAFHQSTDSNLWIGSTEGLTRVNLETEVSQQFAHDPADQTSIPSNRVYDIVRDLDDRIWIATSGGVARLDDADAGSFSQFTMKSVAESYRETSEGMTGLDPNRLSVVDLLIGVDRELGVGCRRDPASWSLWPPSLG